MGVLLFLTLAVCALFSTQVADDTSQNISELTVFFSVFQNKNNLVALVLYMLK